MDELPLGDQGAMALVVNQRGEARLTTIPFVPAERNRSEVRSELTLEAAGGATLRAALEVRGPNAGGVRAAFEAQATRAERIERQLAAHYPGVRVTEVRAQDMNDVERPARLEYDAVVPELGTRQGDELRFAALPALNLSREYAGRSARSTDVMIHGPQTVDERRTIRLPAGATVVQLPPPVLIDSPYFRLEQSVERQGAAVALRRVVVTKVDRVPRAQYAAFREVCHRIDDALGRRLAVRLAGGPR